MTIECTQSVAATSDLAMVAEEQRAARRVRDRQTYHKKKDEQRQTEEKRARLRERDKLRKQRERAEQKRLKAVMSPDNTNSPSAGVQSPTFSMPRRICRTRTPLSGLTPMQLLHNESMERRSEADRDV